MSQTMTDSTKIEISEKDQRWAKIKKYWYMITFIVPAVMLASAGLAVYTGNGAWFWSLVTVFYLIIPIVDTIVGEDPYNPTEEEEKELTENDAYYKRILYVATAGQWLALIATTYAVTQYQWTWYEILGAILSIGSLHAVGLTMSHELGHKIKDRGQVIAAQICSACCGYAHFNIEHNKGHHKDVATPNDPASSRMGESLYKFALRELPGAAHRGWELEAQRLKRLDKSFFSPSNELLQSMYLTI